MIGRTLKAWDKPMHPYNKHRTGKFRSPLSESQEMRDSIKSPKICHLSAVLKQITMSGVICCSLQ